MFVQTVKTIVTKSFVLPIIALMVAAVLASGQSASANAPANPVAAPQSPSSQWISCVPNQIMNYAERVHVRCAAPVGGISYFAIGTSNPANAARVLSVITTAQVAGRTLSILYDPADTSGAAIGCATADCRLIQAVGFGQ